MYGLWADKASTSLVENKRQGFMKQKNKYIDVQRLFGVQMQLNRCAFNTASDPWKNIYFNIRA